MIARISQNHKAEVEQKLKPALEMLLAMYAAPANLTHARRRTAHSAGPRKATLSAAHTLNDSLRLQRGAS